MKEKNYLFLGEGNSSYANEYIKDKIEKIKQKPAKYENTRLNFYLTTIDNFSILKETPEELEDKIKIYRGYLDAENIQKDWEKLLQDLKLSNISPPNRIFFNFPYKWSQEDTNSSTYELLVNLFKEINCWKDLICTLQISYYKTKKYIRYVYRLRDLHFIVDRMKIEWKTQSFKDFKNYQHQTYHGNTTFNDDIKNKKTRFYNKLQDK